MSRATFILAAAPFVRSTSAAFFCASLLSYALFFMFSTGDVAYWKLWLILLSCLVIFVLLPTQLDQIKTKRGATILRCYLILFGGLVACFASREIISFYIFFELSALIVFFMVLGLGYQPERLVASLYLLLFTLLSSMPFFWFLLRNWVLLGISEFEETLFYRCNYFCASNTLFSFFIVLGFLVKFPIYFFHIWLPKAHVEASARGSIILAGVLLKLGVYGIYRVIPIISRSVFWFIYFFSLLGAGIIRILCVRAHDFKILIAYSSVAHMGFLIRSLITANYIGVVGRLAIRIAHGFASSGLFFGAGVLYRIRRSRLMVLNRGQITWAPWFTLVWCLLCFSNIGTPPTPNFWSELFLIFSLTRSSLDALFFIAVPLFFSVCFSLILFMLTQTQKERSEFLNQIHIKKKEMFVFYVHLLNILFIIIFFCLLFK